jgi:hypothetical protein
MDEEAERLRRETRTFEVGKLKSAQRQASTSTNAAANFTEFAAGPRY